MKPGYRIIFHITVIHYFSALRTKKTPFLSLLIPNAFPFKHCNFLSFVRFLYIADFENMV